MVKGLSEFMFPYPQALPVDDEIVYILIAKESYCLEWDFVLLSLVLVLMRAPLSLKTCHWGVHITAVEKLLLLLPDSLVPEASFGFLGGNVFWCQRWTITWADMASGDGEAGVWEPSVRQDCCFPGG